MQGRLLPKINGLYQAHPIGIWNKEYYIASKLGLSSIEFIFDHHLYYHNPIFSDIDSIKKIQSKTGVLTKSICADFFMAFPIQKANKEELIIYKDIIEKLITNLAILGGTDIVLPFVDSSSIMGIEDKEKIHDFLEQFSSLCLKYDVNLALETDLPPLDFKSFIDTFSNNYITVNYDTGNSAALGYLISKELEVYGDKISNIHIKDRKLSKSSVFLGTGDADLNFLKDYIEKINFKGLIIFQAFRDDEGLEIFNKQYEYYLGL